MPLVIEDGTGVVGADSYQSVADYVAYAALYGKIIDNTTAEIQLRQGMDYIESQRYKGTKEFSNTINILKFPRTGIRIDGETIDAATSLTMIKRAQSEVALSINNGIDPLAVKDRVTVSETFGPFSKTYANNGSSVATNPRIDLFLSQLLLAPAGSPVHFKVYSDRESAYLCSHGECNGYCIYVDGV